MPTLSKLVISFPVSAESIKDMEGIEDYVLMIIRNMAGKDVHVLAAKKTALLWDVQNYLSEQTGLISDEIKLMLNYEKPHALTRIGDLDLEANGNVIQLLVEKQIKKLSHMYFVCPNCHQHTNLVFCVDWLIDEECCDHHDRRGHMCCYEEMEVSM